MNFHQFLINIHQVNFFSFGKITKKEIIFNQLNFQPSKIQSFFCVKNITCKKSKFSKLNLKKVVLNKFSNF